MCGWWTRGKRQRVPGSRSHHSNLGQGGEHCRRGDDRRKGRSHLRRPRWQDGVCDPDHRSKREDSERVVQHQQERGRRDANRLHRIEVHLKRARGRENAQIAAFITLEEPTEPMKKEAATAGFYDPPRLLPPVPRTQILTIKKLLAGRKLDYPRIDVPTFKKAPRKRKAKKAE